MLTTVSHLVSWTEVQECETVVITFTMPAIRWNSYGLVGYDLV